MVSSCYGCGNTIVADQILGLNKAILAELTSKPSTEINIGAIFKKQVRLLFAIHIVPPGTIPQNLYALH